MFQKHFSRLLCVVLFALFAAGCIKKTPEPIGPEEPAQPTPTLAEDADFIKALRTPKRSASAITLVAPSSGFSEEDLKRLAQMADALGVRYAPATMNPSSNHDSYLSSYDKVRLRCLKDALTDPGTDVVWAMRGGYGSSRLIKDLSRYKLKKRKIVVGYSDITFLHLYLQSLGWKTVHAAMFGELLNPKKNEQNFRLLADVLSGKTKNLRYDGLRAFNDAASQLSTRISGVLTGGNLTCLAAAEGTPWSLRSKGRIVFIEDVQEPGYKIDRMLTQLKNAGKFNGAKAILLGSFTSGDEHTEFALEKFAGETKIPVFRIDKFGHGPKNYPLVFNAPSVIMRSQGVFTLNTNVGKLP